ncbi:MAG: hypothetical protein WBW48_02825, partial [Anaerolineae bacterium]
YDAYGVYGQSGFGTGVRGEGETGVSGESGLGPGVFGKGVFGVQGMSDIGYGVYGQSNSTSPGIAGVYGVGSSNPAAFPGGYGGYFVGDSGIYAEEEDDAGEDWAGYFKGDVKVTDWLSVDGPATGFFPRPAYDSGWVNISQGEAKTLTHSLGGDTDNYVVDLQFKDTAGVGYGINQLRYGGEQTASGDWTGAHWRRLTNTTIEVMRQSDDPYADQIRVRIWVYK